MNPECQIMWLLLHYNYWWYSVASLDGSSRALEGVKWKLAHQVPCGKPHLLKKAGKLQGYQSPKCESRESTVVTNIQKFLGKRQFEGKGIQGVNPAWWAVHRKRAFVLNYFASKILHPCFVSKYAYLSSANSLQSSGRTELWVPVIQASHLWAGSRAAFPIVTQLSCWLSF